MTDTAVLHGWIALLGGSRRNRIDPAVIQYLLQRNGGAAGTRLLVVPAATSEPEVLYAKYTANFQKQGVTAIRMLDLHPAETDGEISIREALDWANLLVFTGGDQSRLLKRVEDTRFPELLREYYRKGLNIAGSSAGAMVLGNPVILGGDPRLFAKKHSIPVGTGLQLLPDWVIDTHLLARGRIGRLLHVVAAHPKVWGLGIAEDTAAWIGPDGLIQVVGQGILVIVDGRDIRLPVMPEGTPDQLLAVEDFRIHVLPAGTIFRRLTRTEPQEFHTSKIGGFSQ